MVSGNGFLFAQVRKAQPPKTGRSSVSERNDQADGWAKSVEKPSEPAASFTVEPLLVNEETASAMLGVGKRKVWQLGEDEVLQVKRIGRRKLYLVSSLKAFAESGKGVE